MAFHGTVGATQTTDWSQIPGTEVRVIVKDRVLSFRLKVEVKKFKLSLIPNEISLFLTLEFLFTLKFHSLHTAKT